MDKPEIVTRLERLSDKMADCVIKDLPTTQADAMNALDRAAQVIAACVGALEPFARLADIYDYMEDGASVVVNVDRCRDVRAALTLARSKP